MILLENDFRKMVFSESLINVMFISEHIFLNVFKNRTLVSTASPLSPLTSGIFRPISITQSLVNMPIGFV